MEIYDLQGSLYYVVDCSKIDIPSHTERVLSYWESSKVDIPTQLKLLEACINNGTAWKVTSEDTGKDMCCMYCNKVDDSLGYLQSNYMWLANKRVMAILCYYLRMHTTYTNIVFKPHTNDGFIPFEFIIEPYSIRNYYREGTPLEIDLFSKRARYLYDDHFVKYDIREL